MIKFYNSIWIFAKIPGRVGFERYTARDLGNTDMICNINMHAMTRVIGTSMVIGLVGKARFQDPWPCSAVLRAARRHGTILLTKIYLA